MIISVEQDTVQKSPEFACWVGSHDGATMAALDFKPAGCNTQSKFLICADSKQEVIDEAKRLGIVVPERVMNGEEI